MRSQRVADEQPYRKHTDLTNEFDPGVRAFRIPLFCFVADTLVPDRQQFPRKRNIFSCSSC